MSQLYLNFDKATNLHVTTTKDEGIKKNWSKTKNNREIATLIHSIGGGNKTIKRNENWNNKGKVQKYWFFELSKLTLSICWWYHGGALCPWCRRFFWCWSVMRLTRWSDFSKSRRWGLLLLLLIRGGRKMIVFRAITRWFASDCTTICADWWWCLWLANIWMKFGVKLLDFLVALKQFRNVWIRCVLKTTH